MSERLTEASKKLLRKLGLGPAWYPFVKAIEDEAGSRARAAAEARIAALSVEAEKALEGLPRWPGNRIGLPEALGALSAVFDDSPAPAAPETRNATNPTIATALTVERLARALGAAGVGWYNLPDGYRLETLAAAILAILSESEGERDA